MTMQQVHIASTLLAIRQRMEAAAWVRCPCCAGEWTKLHPCPYYFFDGTFKKNEVAWICIECAETLKGFDWIVEHFPIKKPFPQWTDDWIKVQAFWPDNEPRYDEVDAIRINAKTKKPERYREKMFRWSILAVKIRAWVGGQTGAKPSAEIILTSGSNHGKIVAADPSSNLRVPFENAVAAWFWVQARIPKAMESWGEPQEPAARKIRKPMR